MCVLTKIKDIKTCLREFSFCHLDHASVVGHGRVGDQNLSVGICVGATSTARSSYIIVFGSVNAGPNLFNNLTLRAAGIGNKASALCWL